MKPAKNVDWATNEKTFNNPEISAATICLMAKQVFLFRRQN
jgi:hypothetical protein